VTSVSPVDATEAGPRIPVRNAWYLLLYAWELLHVREATHAAVEASPNLLGLLARVLADEARALFRRELGRTFATRTGAVRGIRGRVDFATSLKRLDFEAGRATCVFPELTVDTLKNRIIKSTLTFLARDPRTTAGTKHENGEVLRDELRTLVGAMRDVTTIAVTTGTFRQLALSSSDRRYALPLAICALVHRLELPSEGAGDHLVRALLRDEIVFSDLFERFLRGFFRTHATQFEVGREKLAWPLDGENAFMPEMRTDVTLVERSPARRRLVVEAKYSTTTFATGHYGSKKFKSDNLYQLYAYLRTQEEKGAAHRAAEGLLVYPVSTDEVSEEVVVQGHRIRVAAVHLGKPWESIHARLIELATLAPRAAAGTAA
jgi:5-methylcytosine-specific restriction enzyme subunit McrC